MSDDTTVPVLPVTPVVPPEGAPPEGDNEEWSPPTKEEWLKLQEERDNYKQGMLKEKKDKKAESKGEFITRSEFDKINEQSNETSAVQEMVKGNRDLKENWEAVMAYYYSKKGKASADDIKSDIQDALDLWRIRKDYVKDAKNDASSKFSATTPQIGSSPAVSDKRTEPRNSSDKRFLEALKSHGVDITKI